MPSAFLNLQEGESSAVQNFLRAEKLSVRGVARKPDALPNTRTNPEPH